jgi:hypothetical protein
MSYLKEFMVDAFALRIFLGDRDRSYLDDFLEEKDY